MPGVTVDKYGDILVTQILSYGMEQRKDMIYSPPHKCTCRKRWDRISGIFERNELQLRKLEGLDEYKGWYGSSHPEKTSTRSGKTA